MKKQKSTVWAGLLICICLITAVGSDRPGLQDNQKASAAALIKKSIEEQGIEPARDIFAGMMKDKDRYVFDEREFQGLGMEYLKAGDAPKAVFVFEATVELFPQSFNAYRFLSHALYRSGDEETGKAVQKRMIDVRAGIMLKDYLDKNRDTLASTADEVIARSIDATGGRAAWEAVQTMVVTVSTQGSDGNPYRLERMYKRPAYFRQGIEGADSFAATDGRTFWRVQNGQWTVNENFHLRLVSMDNWLLGYKDYGIAYEFVGYHFINGPLYHLRRSFADGYVQDLYFSTVSNLITEEKGDYIQMLPFMKSFMSYWDYREVGGVKIPHVFIRNVGGLEPPHGGVITDIKINVPLDDSLFIPPDDKT